MYLIVKPNEYKINHIYTDVSEKTDILNIYLKNLLTVKTDFPLFCNIYMYSVIRHRQ